MLETGNLFTYSDEKNSKGVKNPDVEIYLS